MVEVNPDALRRAVEGLHGCRATLSDVVPVVEEFDGQTAWEGIVHVFDLIGHPTARVCYAWSSPVEGSDRRKFYTVLKIHPIHTPADAVRASIVSDARSQQV